MKAPDKIYLHRTIHLGLLSASEIDITGQDEQYIRKGALLEVIKTAREAAVIQKNFNNAPAEQEVRIDAYDYIVNKIESL